MEENACGANITKSYLLYRSVQQQREELNNAKKSKRLLVGHSDDIKQARERADIYLESIRDNRSKLKESLKTVEEKIIQSTLDRLNRAYEIHLDSSSKPMIALNPEKPFELHPYQKRIREDEKMLEAIANEKLDLSTQFLQLEKDWRSMIRNEEDSVFTLLQHYTTQLNQQMQQIKEITSQSHLDSIIQQKLDDILKNIPLSRQVDVPTQIQNALTEELGSQFLRHIMKPRKQPSKNNTSRVRKPLSENTVVRKQKITRKLDRMMTEKDEWLACMDRNLKTTNVERVCQYLEHVDHITKNHKQVLEFINDPLDDVKNQVEYFKLKESLVGAQELEKDPLTPPPQIMLYPDNNNLSAALAVTLTEYTKNAYFSDLIQRLEALEKRVALE